MDVRTGSIHQNLCGRGLGIFLGFQRFPGESNEQPESRSTDVAQWFSNQHALRITGGVGLGKMHCWAHAQSY